MAAITRKFIDFYHYLNEDLADPRTVDYPMISTPFSMLLIILAYNIFVQCIGPRWMKNKKPYNLKKVIVAYDLLQVVVNFWMIYRIVKVTYWTGKYNIFCQRIETGTSPDEIQILDTVYLYFLTKILDLVDTVFFMLSKKSSHVSFLHLYHHSGMVFCGWVGVKYIPGGQAIFFGTINGFVHGLMYTYYLLAALKYLNSSHVFWKRSLTQLQMVQFCLIGLHQLSLLLSPDCGFPRLVGYMELPQNIFMFVLFADFYKKTYLVKKKTI